MRCNTYHDNKGKAVVENESPWMAKILKSLKLGALHNRFEHNLEDKGYVINDVVRRNVETNKCLHEANDDNNKQRKKDDGFFHHDFQHDKHCSKESEAVEIQQQARPEHGCNKRQEVVAELPVLFANIGIGATRQANNSENQRKSQKGIQYAVKGIPESQDMITSLVEFDELVANVTQCEDVQDHFGGV